MPHMTPDEIREARRELGLKQRELAAILGIANADPATVGAWEIGRRTPSGPICAHIATLLAIHRAGHQVPRSSADE